MIPDGRERKSIITTGQSFANPGFMQSDVHHYANPPRWQDWGRKVFPFTKPRPNKERAVFKDGDCNVYFSRLSVLRLRFLHDLFTSLVDIQWRWTLIVFMLANFVSWLFFALIWWLIMYTHGDLEDEHMPDKQAEANWNPCVLSIWNFTSCYLFSIETQYTIGYGVRTTTEECPEAIFMMSVQSIVATTIDAFFTGIVFAKMTNPKLRAQTILFSRNAVVCVHEGVLCLMFRVGDMRKNPLIGASIAAQLIKTKRTKEGELLRHHRTDLDISVDECGTDVFFLWPAIVVHRIDEDSPFYKYSARDLLAEKFEIVVVLEGGVESTGQSVQARSSYVSGEILWGYKFEHILDHLKREDGYNIDYAKFDNVYPVDTPLCSAAELEEYYRNHDAPPEPPRIAGPETDSEDEEFEDDFVRSPSRRQSRRESRSSSRRQSRRPSQAAEQYDEEGLLRYTSSYV